MNISSGKIPSALKVIIYGPEGIGKSTFAARFPRPLFSDTEGSTRHMDVRRFDKPQSWQMLLGQVRYVRDTPGLCSTYVLDTADWAELLCVNDILARYQKSGIEDFGYGKGYVYLAEEFGKLLNALEELVAAGINVVLTAHAKMRKFEQPDEMGSYDRWEMKLGKQTAPMVKEWADMVLFANYKTTVIKEGSGDKAKAKAQGGRRVMYTTHHPCWDAKNRFGLPDMVDFSYDAIAHCIPDGREPSSRADSGAAVLTAAQGENAISSGQTEGDVSPKLTGEGVIEDIIAAAKAGGVPVINRDEGIPPALRELMAANGVTEEEIRSLVSSKGYFPYDMSVGKYPVDFINGALIASWNTILPMIAANRDLF